MLLLLWAIKRLVEKLFFFNWNSLHQVWHVDEGEIEFCSKSIQEHRVRFIIASVINGIISLFRPIITRQQPKEEQEEECGVRVN